MSKAGHLAVCICCGNPFDEEKALLDPEIGGPVDPDCQAWLVWAQSKLIKYAKSKRCVKSNDIDENNFHRFQ